MRHHLIVGKRTADWSGSFLRRAGTDEVVLVRTALGQRLRVRGTEDEPDLEASAWWDLKLHDVVAEEIARLEVAGEEVRARAVVREEPVEEAAAAGGPPGTGEGGEEADFQPLPQLVWKVAEGPELDDPATFVRSFAGARAMKVAPPDAETGLGEEGAPQATVRAETTDGRTLTLEFGGVAPDGEGTRYVRRAGEDVVYIVPAYTAKGLLQPPEPEEPEEEEEAETGEEE